MNYEDNPRSIKFYVKRYIINNGKELSGKRIVDFPAGNGITSRILKGVGADPVPFDLFPEYFTEPDMTCVRANISEGIPMEDKSADGLICQEGIEHFSDQFGAFKEFNRVMKKDGVLIITTPNYSNIRSRMSYMLAESERFNSMMPPNELDSIWMSDQEISDELYFGHIFLIGIQKLRTLAKLNGFRIKKVHFVRAKNTSVLLFPFVYPWIWFSNWIAYRKNLRKNKKYDYQTKKEAYREMYKLGINAGILVGSHLMVEFVKEQDTKEVAGSLKSQHADFGLT